LLSWLAAVFAGISTVALIGFVPAKLALSLQQKHAFVSIAFAYLLWLPARAYSEWYAGAGTPDLEGYDATAVAVAVLFIVALAVGTLEVRERKLQKWVWAVVSGVATILTALAVFAPSLFAVMARIVAQAPPMGLITIYAGMAISAFMLWLPSSEVSVESQLPNGAKESEGPLLEAGATLLPEKPTTPG